MVDPRRTPRQLPKVTPPPTTGSTRRIKRPEPPQPPPPPPPPTWARPLAWALIGLVALILLGRALRPEPEAPAVVEATEDTVSVSGEEPIPEPVAAAAPVAPVAQATGPSPIDMMVRAESQRRIVQAGRQVYFDSLLAASDSVLRRWVATDGSPILVAITEDSLYQALGAPRAVLEDAAARWNALRLGVELQVAADPSQAVIVIEWLDRADAEERHLGQTFVSSNADGSLSSANITLPAADANGRRLTRAALLLWATHELGHALGLAHSDEPSDAMFAIPRTATPSDRDARTAQLLYGLPPGSVKGQ